MLDKDQADFIVAYRQGGAYTGKDAGKPISGAKLDLTQKGNEKLTTILDLIGVKTRIAKAKQLGRRNRQQGNGNGGRQLSRAVRVRRRRAATVEWSKAAEAAAVMTRTAAS